MYGLMHFGIFCRRVEWSDLPFSIEYVILSSLFVVLIALCRHAVDFFQFTLGPRRHQMLSHTFTVKGLFQNLDEHKMSVFHNLRQKSKPALRILPHFAFSTLRVGSNTRD